METGLGPPFSAMAPPELGGPSHAETQGTSEMLSLQFRSPVWIVNYPEVVQPLALVWAWGTFLLIIPRRYRDSFQKGCRARK